MASADLVSLWDAGGSWQVGGSRWRKIWVREESIMFKSNIDVDSSFARLSIAEKNEAMFSNFSMLPAAFHTFT